jgi:uncharacterized protein
MTGNATGNSRPAAPEERENLPLAPPGKRTARGSQEHDRDRLTSNQGNAIMARFEILDQQVAAQGGEARADIFCEMGLMYATGRDCAVDLVAAHKWLNIAAIKGSERAAALRAELAETMTKADLAAALRAAREWMTIH